MSKDQSHPRHSAFALALKFDQLSAEESREFYLQLLQCPHCTKAFQELTHWSAVLGHPSPRVATEYVTRHKLHQELILSGEPALKVIQADSIYHSWGLCTVFLEQSLQALKWDAEQALDLALVGAQIAQLLSKDFYFEALVNDLIGKAQMAVLEAQLQAGKTSESMSLVSRLRVLLRLGTGRPELLASLDLLEGRILRFLGAKEEALKVLDRGLRSSLEALHQPSRMLSGIPCSHDRFSTGFVLGPLAI